MDQPKYKKIKSDSYGRIYLGGLAPKGVSSYRGYREEDTLRIILEPYVEVPAKELLDSDKSIKESSNSYSAPKSDK